MNVSCTTRPESHIVAHTSGVTGIIRLMSSACTFWVTLLGNSLTMLRYSLQEPHSVPSDAFAEAGINLFDGLRVS